MFTHEGKQWPAAMASCEQRALGTCVCVCRDGLQRISALGWNRTDFPRSQKPWSFLSTTSSTREPLRQSLPLFSERLTLKGVLLMCGNFSKWLDN